MSQMYKYSQCHDRARYLIKNYKFFNSLPKVEFDGDLGLVMGKDGPVRQHHGELLRLRRAIADSVRATNKSEGEVIVGGCSGSSSRSLGGWLRSGSFDIEDRVASIKMMRHLYLQVARGGTEVWIYSPPKKYTEWVFDELNGFANTGGLSVWTSQVDEVYSKDDKKAMGDATQLAKAWSARCVAKLGSPDDATNEVIKRWFCAADADDATVKKAAAKVLAGMKKILSVLNSKKLVLSDEPIDRNGGGWKDYAFVYQSEKMNVIYIQNATLKAAKNGKMWDAALTIVHELSHRELHTDDHRYGDDGGKLGPSAGAGALTVKQAMTNADNWGYFAADLNGALQNQWRKYVSGIA